ncbi:ATP-binding protein [Streptomyces spiroverticillatus]|uniref:ATP-binding protein n=2 Tax=Streptomyces finlayi TaxID=67296 RepID=A0A919C8S9_9ACTN|nr:ATP-binding protein [Streptomyces spiroverticillatus]GHC86315.1 ATP-binding protein [Streptomyces finlayi]
MWVGVMTRQQPGRPGPVAKGRTASGDTRAGETTGGGRASPQMRCRLGRADLTAVADARHALRELLRTWGRPDCADVAELLTSELVTNALIHTESDAELTATLAASTLRVEVHDHLSRMPEPQLASCDENTHGRGLLLVQALADAWGVRMQGHGPGKVVWFELDGGPAAT